jgi:hypothetical protein
MTAINTIIFSKDRAMQLDALLRSIHKFAPQIEYPLVIWRSTGEDFDRAYRVLRIEHGIQIRTQREQDFAADVKKAICCSLPLLQFLVDDDVFYRKVPCVKVYPGCTFAPRLGVNCTHCYAVDAKCNLDFCCEFSLDGHVYRLDDVREGITAAGFTNPNTLETAMSWFHTALVIGQYSSLVGIPHNRVGDNTNRHAGGDPAELNRRYLEGWRIDLDAMDFRNVIGAHQDIEYRFKRGDERC